MSTGYVRTVAVAMGASAHRDPDHRPALRAGERVEGKRAGLVGRRLRIPMVTPRGSARWSVYLRTGVGAAAPWGLGSGRHAGACARRSTRTAVAGRAAGSGTAVASRAAGLIKAPARWCARPSGAGWVRALPRVRQRWRQGRDVLARRTARELHDERDEEYDWGREPRGRGPRRIAPGRRLRPGSFGEPCAGLPAVGSKPVKLAHACSHLGAHPSGPGAPGLGGEAQASRTGPRV
jgi:hypothetical protein